MNVPNKFVSIDDEDVLKKLESLVKKSEKAKVRQRAHAIILSSKKFSIDEMASIYAVGRNAVSSWITLWELLGFDGLHDKDRPGGPSKLNDSEKELLFYLAKETPRSVTSMITALFEKTGKQLSESSIKRLLKNAGLKWKRIRKITQKQPNPEKFETARQEIDELKKQHNNGDIELWFFDETGFDLEPTVPYAWQPLEIIEVPSSTSQRLNVLGFLTPDNQFESFRFECSVDTDVVIATFDKFAQTESSKKRVIILDNASIHTSHKFLDKIEDWEEQGLFIKYLLN